MAILMRGGAYADFDPSKLKPREWAVVLENDPSAKDGKAIYICFAAGNVKRISTYEDMYDDLLTATDDIKEQYIQVFNEIKQEIESLKADTEGFKNTAETKAQESALSAQSAGASADTATQKADVASASAVNAADSADDSEGFSKLSESYAIGTGGVRPNEANDNAKKYYEQSKEIYDNFNSAGNVTGVKGDAETTYRTGNVNITPENIGMASVLMDYLLKSDLPIYYGVGDKTKIKDLPFGIYCISSEDVKKMTDRPNSISGRSIIITSGDKSETEKTALIMLSNSTNGGLYFGHIYGNTQSEYVWIDILESQLNGDVAANLQQQINALAVKPLKMVKIGYLMDEDFSGASSAPAKQYKMLTSTYGYGSFSGLSEGTLSRYYGREKAYKEGTYVVFLRCNASDLVVDETDGVENTSFANQDVIVEFIANASRAKGIKNGVTTYFGTIEASNYDGEGEYVSNCVEVSFSGLKKSTIESRYGTNVLNTSSCYMMLMFSVKLEDGDSSPKDFDTSYIDDVAFVIDVRVKVRVKDTSIYNWGDSIPDSLIVKFDEIGMEAQVYYIG